MKRQKKARNKFSDYKGIRIANYAKGLHDKWEAFITINKRQRYLGSFRTEEQAAMAYDREAKKNGYDTSELNFPDRDCNE